MDETVADATQVKYRCPCGVEFQVSANRGGNCPVCERRVSPSALEELVASTVSFVEFANLKRSVAAEDPQVDPWVGKQLGHFEVIERLGGGGMGAVYRALDRSLQRYVAVKLIRTSTDQAPEDKKVKALLQEAVAQARVHHPNVVTIYYVSHDQQTPFLAMELMSSSLGASSRRGPLPFTTVMDIAIQVTAALRASYQLDVVHGDIKPSNLLVDRLGTVKLSDFGLARRIDLADEEQATLRGTPNYLSPAILRGEPPNFRSDLYALGITLYELTFGTPPQQLSGQSVAVWLQQRSQLSLTAPAGKLDHVPRHWLPLLERLLELNLAEPFRDYDELLQHLVNARPTPEFAAGRLPRLVAWSVDQVVIASVVVSLTTFALSRQTSLWGLWGLIFMLPALLYGLVSSRLGMGLGYFAMQLSLLDGVGQLPDGKTRVLREGLRTVVFWLFLGCLVALDTRREPVFYALAGTVWTLFFVDAIAILLPGSCCLHDRLFKTSVVLRRAGR